MKIGTLSRRDLNNGVYVRCFVLDYKDIEHTKINPETIRDNKGFYAIITDKKETGVVKVKIATRIKENLWIFECYDGKVYSAKPEPKKIFKMKKAILYKEVGPIGISVEYKMDSFEEIENEVSRGVWLLSGIVDGIKIKTSKIENLWKDKDLFVLLHQNKRLHVLIL